MSDKRTSDLVQEAMTLRYTRRQILRRATALGLSIPAISAVLAACGEEDEDEGAAGAQSGGASTETGSAEKPTAPAVLKGSKLNVLASTYFVPAGQDLYESQLNEWGNQEGVEVSVDFVNWPDLQPKIGAAIQGGSGPDVVELWDTWPYLYYQSMVDVHDMATKIGDTQGGYYDWATKTASIDGHWYSIPHGNSTSAMAYRISYFKEAGVADPQKDFPKTWEELFEVGKNLKEMGKPLGQALGHSLGDPPAFTYSYMWAYGAMEVEEDGTTVAFHNDQFVDGMTKFVQGWKDAYDETGLGWDDSTNNRAFLADQISGTFNGSSVYLAAQKDAPDIAEDTDHVGFFEGPAGRFNMIGSRSYGIMKHSKSQDAAKAFLEWWYEPAQYTAWLEAQEGYIVPAVPGYADNPIYTNDPKLAPYSDVVNYGRSKGYAGAANEKAALSYAKYIVIDAFAKAIQDGNPEEAIKWGADQLKQIYST